MSLKGRNQRFIFKITSSRLRQNKWNLNLKLKEAVKTGEVVGIGESQLIRWLDELNGIENCEETIVEIKENIEKYRTEIRTDENIRPVLKSLYQQLDHYSFKKDYITVVMDSVSDYRKLYKNGFKVNGIKFRRLLGTSSGIKVNTIVFINEKYYEEIFKRITNGRDLNKEFVPAKLEAYQALVCSSSIPVSMPKKVICVPDCYTHFKADVIELDDLEDGEPKMSFVKNKDCEQCANDGYGLGTPELLQRWGKDIGEDYILSSCVIRNAFCKGTILPIDFKEFASNHGVTKIEDSWGIEHNIDEVELILTESMLKLWSSYSSIDSYLNKCNENHYSFCITKAAEDELENVRNMNYQFLQSYNFTDDDIDELINPTISEIQDILKNDWRKTICYTKGVNLSKENINTNFNSDFSTALMIEPTVLYDDYVQSQIQGMINKRIQDSKIGVLKVNGCYSLISGDPYVLCQSIMGLEPTGLLKAGEIYSQYWNKRNKDQIVLYRAPMTVHSNIKKMNVVHTDEMEHFYRYIKSVIIFNNFDTSPDAMNGFDFDGDAVISTSNEVLIKNTKNLPAVQCIQYKANKKIPSEDDIFESNILGFGNAVGGITNKVTSMFEVQARFPIDSEEYKIMDYRTKCGQLYQQESIDAIKGIKAKPMPKYWHDFYATKISEDDDEKTKTWKEYQRTLVADKKPYFFRYVYPKDNAKWIKYIKDSNFKAIMQFGKEIDELKESTNKTTEEEMFLKNYDKLLPLGIAPCTINRICWKIEDTIKNERMNNSFTFNYELLKDMTYKYNVKEYNSIKNLYNLYISDRNLLDKYNHSNKIEPDDYICKRNMLNLNFKRDCTLVCPNKYILCNILIDICYEDSIKSKRMVWEMCGDVLIENLLKRHNYYFNCPVKDINGEFEFGGINFSMQVYKYEGAF